MGENDLRSASAAIGVVALAILFTGVIFAIYPGWAVIGNFLAVNVRLTQDAPAWVQAFGSISAILITAYIARIDSRRRKKDNAEAHAKEMRRIAYFLNKTGVAESLYFLLTDFSKSKRSKFSSLEIKYLNIFFVLCVTGSIKKAYTVVKSIESSASMELLTSKCSNDFFVIFNNIESLNGFCNLEKLRLSFDENLFVINGYIDFVSSKKHEELIVLDAGLEFAVDSMRQQLHELEKSCESIKSHMTC